MEIHQSNWAAYHTGSHRRYSSPRTMLHEGQGELEGFLDRPPNFLPYFLCEVGELENEEIEPDV